MQPLISPVDHESRHYYHDDDQEETDGPQEYTALITRYDRPRRASPLTPVFISLMFILLMFGVTIGSYLLIEQDKQWPVNIPFEMISKEEWGGKAPKWPIKRISVKPVTYVILTHTGTSSCTQIDTCSAIMRDLQVILQNSLQNISDIPFSFMVGGDGETYEGRGWDVESDMNITMNQNSLCLAAIGNFTTIQPFTKQLKEFKAFIDESIRRKKLSPYYKLVGEAFRGRPNSLFNAVSKWKHWEGISDT